MRVEHIAQGGHVTERFRVDFEGHELQALADLANVIQGDDSLARALARAGREWRLDADPQGVLTTSATGDGAGEDASPRPEYDADASRNGVSL